MLRCDSVLCAAFRIFAACKYIGVYLQAAVCGCPYLEVVIFRPFSIRRGRPFLCVVYSLHAAGGCPCCLYLSVSWSVFFSSVEALPSLSVSFISGAVQFISRGRRAVLRLWPPTARKGRGLVDTPNERANVVHAAKEQRRAASSSPHGGRLSILSTLSILERGVYGIASTRGGCVCMWRGVSRVVEALGRLPPVARYAAGLTM